MSKLLKIKGYWDMYGLFEFNDDDMWKGKFLLEDDGWFEGIVKDKNSKYNGDRFVFGIYHPDKVIELIKVSPADISDPIIFRGNKNNDGYYGVMSVAGFIAERVIGVSRIETDSFKRETNDDLKDLQNRIKAFKDINDFKDLYENTKRIREDLSKYVLEKYEGETFSREDIQDIIAPVEEEVLEAALSDIIKRGGR